MNREVHVRSLWGAEDEISSVYPAKFAFPPRIAATKHTKITKGKISGANNLFGAYMGNTVKWELDISDGIRRIKRNKTRNIMTPFS